MLTGDFGSVNLGTNSLQWPWNREYDFKLVDFTHSHPSFIVVFHGRIGSIFHRNTIIGGRVGLLHGFETALWIEMRCFVLVMSRSMFACWYHVGIYARDQSKQISSGSLLSSMLRHCYHLYPYPHMIYMIVSMHICICIDVYLYLYLCHIFASIYQLSQQWKPRPATQ